MSKNKEKDLNQTEDIPQSQKQIELNNKINNEVQHFKTLIDMNQEHIKLKQRLLKAKKNKLKSKYRAHLKLINNKKLNRENEKILKEEDIKKKDYLYSSLKDKDETKLTPLKFKKLQAQIKVLKNRINNHL